MPPAPLISIVDDDDFLRNSLNNLLRSVGMRTHGFSSADEFLNSNELHDTDCLILDVRMPGMSGLDLQRQLRAANSQIPIVFITSHADDDAPGASARGRCGGFFVQALPKRSAA